MVSKVNIRVLIVLVLAKLVLRRQSIRPKLNFPPATIYSLILSLVHSIGSSSYRVLNSDLGTIAFLYFLTYTPLVYKSIWSFLIYIQLQFLKIYTIKFWKSSLQASYSLSSLKLQTLYSKVLNYTKLLISVILVLSESTSIPLPYFFCPSITYCLISIIVVLVIIGNLYSVLKYVIDANA